jgi:hypothetical protein
MESKVCSRSQGHPPGARRRAMIETASSKRFPVSIGFYTSGTPHAERRGNSSFTERCPPWWVVHIVQWRFACRDCTLCLAATCFCSSAYCFMTSRSTRPTIATKDEFVQSRGSRSRKAILPVRHFPLVPRAPHHMVLIAVHHVVVRFGLSQGLRDQFYRTGLSNATDKPHFMLMTGTTGAFIPAKSGKCSGNRGSHCDRSAGRQTSVIFSAFHRSATLGLGWATPHHPLGSVGWNRRRGDFRCFLRGLGWATECQVRTARI